MTFYQLINTAIFSSLLFLAILTIAKKNNSANGYRFLSLFFIFVSFNFFDDAASTSGFYTAYPWLIIIFQPTLFAIAPAFYLAVFYLTAPGKKLSPIAVLHFIPYFFFIALYILAFLLTDSQKLILPDNSVNAKQTDVVLLLILFTQIFIYLFLSVKKIKKHQSAVPLFASNLHGNDFSWLTKITIGLIILSFVWLAEALLDKIQLSFYISFIYLLGVYYIGVQVIRQKDVFDFSNEQLDSINNLTNEYGDSILVNDNQEAEHTPTEITEPKKKVLSDEKLQQYKELLLKLMDTQKPYLDCELTLPKLAKMITLNTYQTSYLINTSFNENFYNFINRYRVEECKRMLENNQHNHLSVLGIGFEAGFNSKTAYHTMFKKLTGLSPKEYKEKMNKAFPQNGSPVSNSL